MIPRESFPIGTYHAQPRSIRRKKLRALWIRIYDTGEAI